MPVYCYRDQSGELHEMVMTIQEMKRKQRIDGSIRLPNGIKAWRDFVAEQRDVDPSPGAYRDHRVSMVFDVRADDIPTRMAEDKRIGSMASEYRPLKNGEAELKFTSKKQYDRYLRDRGFVDKDSYTH